MSSSIKIDVREPLVIQKGCSYEDFVSTLQRFSSSLLCVINGSILVDYKNTTEIPATTVYIGKEKTNDGCVKYFFKDLSIAGVKYCVFGREAASVFYPYLHRVDPIEGVEESRYSIVVTEPNQPLDDEYVPPPTNIRPRRSKKISRVAIVDGDETIEFAMPPYPTKIEERRYIPVKTRGVG